MLYELSLFDANQTTNELKSAVYSNIGWGASAVITHPYYLSKIVDLVNDAIKLGIVIDYPYGLGNYTSRHHAVVSACKQNIQILELVVNPIVIRNNERKNLIQDIKTAKTVCDDRNIELRIMLDYRMFSDRLIFATVELCSCLGVTKFVSSTGQFVDDFYDNLLICGMIQNKFPSTQCILNSSFCSDLYLEQSKSHNIYGIRLKSFLFLKNRCITP